LDLLGKSIFHYDFGRLDGKGDKLYSAYKAILAYSRTRAGRLTAIFPVLDKLPIPAITEFHRSIDYIKNHFNQIIKERGGKNYGDILDSLLSAVEDKSGEKLSHVELLSNLWIFFIAGHETTASALSWACICLATYQDIQEKLYQEVITKIGENAMPTLEQLSDMSYLDQFIQELLRLHSPVQLLPSRKTMEDLKYKQYLLPKGSTIGINFNAIHRHPKYWPEPNKFDPERFTPENKKGRHHFAYLPFSLGPRQCIGNVFSLIEQRLFLVRLLQKFRILPPRHSPLHSVDDMIDPSVENRLRFDPS